MARFCVYADGSTISKQSNEECPAVNNGHILNDTFDIPDTEVTVNADLFWLNVAIFAILIGPWLWEQVSKRR